MSNHCQSCNANIVFLKTKKGGYIPVNKSSLTPSDLIVLRNKGSLSFRYGEHITHFATCPNASKHRRKE
jgi:hypothetical protein